ncbi:MAG: hypothetical protein A2700_02550 [Candidatus Blackburnbacteria bacterium RIFCSPHIGHO2_01_FULL_44_64]|uniref:Uncharacterized protein n=1 Tax=Candidatus Blackburnbacteria bacterium RIFCSPHIGHO2_02_FULL_44_20 TaxID=1797516 RepID=A0A1G1V919_9BACT|nr:MAG: hypothetical protein A2700_02550 [Candidatus Blackburnbacteria bacterium RIFCSPHIGHO2_01_FULL_44_64]OGY11806.1 MAG: hypothetical protein A3E16_00605 [Candidatus Blackburnbacteria bacterium RIFCSPHIGHO2_12_FULL_44_25]OGY11853.1 MAG: hypothetical protein A3D26_01100 [Candidatus Blackburnbacteria bacterium RIFCSPHIGHO2_02_FULL_44_20]OGY14462.1 MAG: hypothetical protein A3A62_00295 [Candidatus Blackburnbacteria bacterium RIFCSPLOWO2_01_FULL_44_43]OGY15824.1 MAG: hypothetical protein A3H88_0
MHENEQGRGYDGEFFDDPDAPVDKPDWFRERFSNRHRLSARQKRGLLALAREFERRASSVDDQGDYEAPRHTGPSGYLLF